MATKKNIFQEHLTEWLKARGNRKKRAEITRHICFVTKIHPKSVSRSFKRVQMYDGGIGEQRGRPEYYTPDVIFALKELWDMAGEPCGGNLHPMIPEYIVALRRDNLWKHGDIATGKLLAMSEGLMKKRVGNFVRSQYIAHGKSTPKPGSILSLIPVRSDGWGEAPTGTMQVDTVAHCGNTLVGDFIYTVNATDVATLWGVRRAQMNKGQEATVRSMGAMEEDSPFPPLEWHPDSGSEFINWHCKGWCEERGTRLTRSRPNHKNDNCFVEERNGHIVRRYVGYSRLSAYETVIALNEFYDVLTPYLNHFVANRRTVSKERIGARWKIAREKKAMTPYQRVLSRDDVSEEVKRKLRIEHMKLNPLILKREVDRRLKKVFDTEKRCGNR